MRTTNDTPLGKIFEIDSENPGFLRKRPTFKILVTPLRIETLIADQPVGLYLNPSHLWCHVTNRKKAEELDMRQWSNLFPDHAGRLSFDV
jgi:hypothetical protein